MIREVPGCSGKVQYPTRDAARLVMVHMKSRGRVQTGERLNAYACRFCSLWHLGRSTADEREYVRFKARHAAQG